MPNSDILSTRASSESNGSALLGEVDPRNQDSAELHFNQTDVYINGIQTTTGTVEALSFATFFNSLSHAPLSSMLSSFDPLGLILMPTIAASEITFTLLAWSSYCYAKDQENKNQLKQEAWVETGKSALIVGGCTIGVLAGYFITALAASTLYSLASPVLFIAALAVMVFREGKATYTAYRELCKTEYTQDKTKYKAQQGLFLSHLGKTITFTTLGVATGFAIIVGSAVAALAGIVASLVLTGLGIYDGLSRHQAMKQENRYHALSEHRSSETDSENSNTSSTRLSLNQ